MPLDSRKPRPQEPCNTPLMNPRERAGQDSMASAAPAGHSAPMPMPSSARNTNRNQKLGAKPAMKLQIEYHRIEIISGVLRPTRSASQPDATTPTRGTSNSLAIGTMINRNIVKSNASSVQPSQAAIQASHWSFVGSFHQGIDVAGIAAVAMTFPSALFGSGRSPDDGSRFFCNGKTINDGLRNPQAVRFGAGSRRPRGGARCRRPPRWATNSRRARTESPQSR